MQMEFSGTSFRKVVSLTVTYPSKLTQAFETWWGTDSWVSILKTESWKRRVARFRRVCRVEGVLWRWGTRVQHPTPVLRPSHAQNRTQLASPRRPRLGLIHRFLALGRVEERALGPGELSRCLAQLHSTGGHSGCPSCYQLAKHRVTEKRNLRGKAEHRLGSKVTWPSLGPCVEPVSRPGLGFLSGSFGQGSSRAQSRLKTISVTCQFLASTEEPQRP